MFYSVFRFMFLQVHYTMNWEGKEVSWGLHHDVCVCRAVGQADVRKPRSMVWLPPTISR